jgi:D-lactate dehydrogenase (cytochrome)
MQGEHGIGLGKKESLLLELGPETINVMRSIKRSLDPRWLMNPGKIFEAQPSQVPHDSAQQASHSKLEWHG